MMDVEGERRDECSSAVDLVPHPDVVARRVEDEMVLVHLKTNRIYALNRTAAKFWELLSEGHNRQESIEKMRHLFDVPESELQAECDRLISRLKNDGLLRDPGRIESAGESAT